LSRTLELRTILPYRGGLRRRHVSRGLGPRLLAEESSDVATFLSAPDIASLSRWAPALPRVLWLRALLARGENFGAATSPTAPSGQWTIGIKIVLAALVTQLGSRVFKARSCITEALTIRASCYNVALQCSVGPIDHSWT
jgi:hypothetical protein